MAVPTAWATFTPPLRGLNHRSRSNSDALTRTPILPHRRRRHPHHVTPRACDIPPSAAVDQVETIPDYAPTLGVYPHSDADTQTRPVKTARSVPLPSAPEPARTDIPGPKPLPVFGNALDILSCPLSDLMLRYARGYGPLVRFSIVKDELYLLSDPEGIQHITMANSRNYLDRWTPPGFELLLYDGKLRGLVFSQGRYWMQHRQVVGSVFRSPDFLNHYVDTVIEKTRFMMDELWPKKLHTKVNVHQEMRMLTLDIIGAAAFGAEFGAMTSENGAHEIETCLSNILHGVLDVIKSPVPLWRFMRTPGRAAIQNDLDRLQQIEMGLIHKRREQLRQEGGHPKEASKKDLLGLLLRARDSDRSINFKDEDLMWDVHDVIFAGHETTASALAASLFLIAGSPQVLRKIQEELREHLPGNRVPTFDDISKLKYLDMVLNESLRLYPPTALIGRHAKSADIISGYEIPKGANILMSPYVMGRLEHLWDNPEEFRPERFSPEQVAARHPMIHTPFGSGPRICLGARMATMEAKVILAMVFQKYSFERTESRLEVEYDSTVSFKSGMDMMVRKSS